MKQTPSNKPHSYLNNIKAAYETLALELKAAEDALLLANDDCAKKEKIHSELIRQDLPGDATRKASREASAAQNHAHSIKFKVRELKTQLEPLHLTVSAHKQFAQAKQSIEKLSEQKRLFAGEVVRVDSLLEKVAKRIDAADACIAADTLSATQALLTTDGGFSVPESLVKSELELRLSKISQAQLQKEKDALNAKLGELPEALREAQKNFIFYRAVIAEIDLCEQLAPLMPLFAKAAAARYQNDYNKDESQWNINITGNLIDAAHLDLEDELGKLTA